MAREDPQLKLRLTEEMKAKVTEAAKANNRSVNAEIVDRLALSFTFADELKAIAEAMSGFAERVDVLETVSDDELKAVLEEQAATHVLKLIVRMGALPEDILEGLRDVFLSAGADRVDLLESVARKIYNKRELNRRYVSIQELLLALEERLASKGEAE